MSIRWQRWSSSPRRGRIAAALVEQLLALTPEQLDYKGLTLERDRLVERLGEMGAVRRWLELHQAPVPPQG